MTDDASKRAILARRARFIAAAIMGAGLVSCDRKSTEPSVCLSVALVPEPDAAAPMPCLSPPPLPPMPADAGASVSDGGPGDAGGAGLDGGVPQTPGPAGVDAGTTDGGAVDGGAGRTGKKPSVPPPPPPKPYPTICLSPPF